MTTQEFNGVPVFIWHDDALFGRRFRHWEHQFLRQTWPQLIDLWAEKSVEFWQCFNDSFEAYYAYYIFARQYRHRTPDLCAHTMEAFKKLITADSTEKEFSKFMDRLLSLLKLSDRMFEEVPRFAEISFEKGSCVNDPFFLEDTRDGYRYFFGPAVRADAYAKAANSLEVYVHYAYSVTEVLRRRMFKKVDVAAQGPDKLKKPPLFPLVTGRGPATSRFLINSAKYFHDLYDQEIAKGSPEGPRFICCWRLGDPRFVDPKNPLYDSTAARGSDWRTHLTLRRYMDLCEYVLDVMIPRHAKVGVLGPVCCAVPWYFTEQKVTAMPPEMVPMITLQSLNLAISQYSVLGAGSDLHVSNLATPDGTDSATDSLLAEIFPSIVADKSTSNVSTVVVQSNVASSATDKPLLSATIVTFSGTAATAHAAAATTAVTTPISAASAMCTSAMVGVSTTAADTAPTVACSHVGVAPGLQSVSGSGTGAKHSPGLSKQPASAPSSAVRSGPAAPSQPATTHGVDRSSSSTQKIATNGTNDGALPMVERDLLGILCPACTRPLEKGRCMTCEHSEVPNAAGLSKEVINKISQVKNKDKKRLQLQQKLQKKHLYNEFTNQPQIKQLLVELCIGLEAEGLIDDLSKKRQALVERLQSALTDKLLRGFSPDCIATIHAIRMELVHQSETWVHWFIRECPEESGQFFNSEQVKQKVMTHAAGQLTDVQKLTDSVQQVSVSAAGKVAGAVSKDVSQKSSAKVSPLRYCANESCRVQEVAPKTFKKCQKCVEQKAKEPRYYCSQGCQVEDWAVRHRQEHTIQPVQLDIQAPPQLLFQAMSQGLQFLP